MLSEHTTDESCLEVSVNTRRWRKDLVNLVVAMVLLERPHDELVNRFSLPVLKL